MDLQKKFWRFVDKNGPIHPMLGTRCWLWIGRATGTPRYGRVAIKDSSKRCGFKDVKAHRFSLELEKGRQLAPDNEACHRCDVSLCVRPDHLFEGTHAENMADAARKRRTAFGERAKGGRRGGRLTEAIVLEARRRFAAGGVSMRALAREYGVTNGPMVRAINGNNWRHLGET